MVRALCYTLGGYLMGSLLFAKYFGFLFRKRDVTLDSPDRNPGTYNAFLYGGMRCGIPTICCDLLKGFLPVFLYLRGVSPADPAGALALVLAAPVLGHGFSLYAGFRGGKGIAVSFGCLLGLLPEYLPVTVLVVSYLFFSLVLRIPSHGKRTAAAYSASAVLLAILRVRRPVFLGFLLICGTIFTKHLLSIKAAKRQEAISCES